jgi:hypothetical protein
LDYPTKTEMSLDKAAAAKLIKEASADASKALSKQLQARLGSLLDKRSGILFGANSDDAFWKSQASEAGPAGEQYGDDLVSVVTRRCRYQFSEASFQASASRQWDPTPGRYFCIQKRARPQRILTTLIVTR